jgi:HAD superfamily hydrolase (TIGR01509 family)
VPALIFDFDGLIVETEMIVFAAWAQVLGEMGKVVDASDFLPMVGTHQPGLFESMVEEWLGPHVDLQELRRRAQKIHQPMALAAPVREGVLELIDEAESAGWRIGLGSSSPRAWIVAHLDHRKLLDRFQAIVAREDVGNVKPAPDIFLRTARRLGVAARRCVVLEDSAPGCRAARAAGMHCVAVPTEMTRSSDFSDADLVVGSLSELRLARLSDLLGR